VDTNVLVRLVVSSSVLKMEAIVFSETSVAIYQVTWSLDTAARISYTSSKHY